jgi:DNA-binding SARP family transcriptional activator
VRSEHEFRVLGPLEVSDGGDTVSLGGRRQRMVLAVLLLHANRVVSVKGLIDGVWGESRSPTALKTLQAYVARQRRTIGEDALTASNSGYVLRVEAEDLDSDRLQDLPPPGVSGSSGSDEGCT